VKKIPIKTKSDIELMRTACQVTARILHELKEVVKPGVSTEDINTFVHKRTLELKAVPATLNYRGYPKSCCTSVNEVICHGIPSQLKILQAGDIINVDVTSIKSGFYGDASCMYLVGGAEKCSSEAVDLVNDTLKALHEGIAVVKPDARVGDIGAAIQGFIQKSGKNYGIVREYTGHGIGREFHELPQILHVGRQGVGEKLKEGMTFTVEPMINLGTHKTVLSESDGWTVKTADGLWSAQWEHTVLVTSTGVEMLTVLKE
jgi:methionyl aminopeptidase